MAPAIASTVVNQPAAEARRASHDGGQHEYAAACRGGWR